jgi:hypothetical protein
MALFEFELKPLQSIQPWGEPDDPNLHWFGLTDGYYYLDAKGNQIYRYTEEILAHWKNQNISIDPSLPYPDYQVVRLYEDFLDILSNIYQPIPSYIFDRIESMASFEHFLSRLNDFYKNEEDEELLDTFSIIRSFLGSRQLDSMHLSQGPSVWFFRNNDNIYLRWLNESKAIDGIPVWQNSKGEAIFSYFEFVKEVIFFHESFINQMELRVSEVLAGKLSPNIRVDFKGLKIEQDNRKQSLELALKTKCEFQEWETLERIMKEFELFQW